MSAVAVRTITDATGGNTASINGILPHQGVIDSDILAQRVTWRTELRGLGA